MEGDIENVDGILKITTIRVKYHLKVTADQKEAAREAFDSYEHARRLKASSAASKFRMNSIRGNLKDITRPGALHDLSEGADFAPSRPMSLSIDKTGRSCKQNISSFPGSSTGGAGGC